MRKIEEVAKALGDYLYGYVDAGATPSTWETSMSLAKIAIATVREPTEPMIAALTCEQQCCFISKQEWQAAIDEAMK